MTQKPGETDNALLETDSGYTILLEQNGSVGQKDSWKTEYVLIHDGEIRGFEGFSSTAISRQGHFAGMGEDGLVIVYYPGEVDPYTLTPVGEDGSETTTFGYAISPGGKTIYRTNLAKIAVDDEFECSASLVEYNLDLRRDLGAIKLFELGKSPFGCDDMALQHELSRPLHLSEHGGKVFFRTLEAPGGIKPYAERPTDVAELVRGRPLFGERLGGPGT